MRLDELRYGSFILCLKYSKTIARQTKYCFARRTLGKTKQSVRFALLGKIASKCKLFDCFTRFTSRNDVKNKKVFSPLTRPAFTLAEILITLGIIGIVAAISIPALINNTNDAQYKTLYKKAYSTIYSAYTLITSESSGTINGTFSNSNEFRDLFLQKMPYIKKCDVGLIQGDCWNTVGAYKYNTNTQYQSDNWWFSSGSGGINNSGAILSNGTAILFSYWAGTFTCTNYSGSVAYEECGRIYIDTNGLKPPNQAGKDILRLFIYADKIKPDGDGSTCGSTSSGLDCSSYYLFH